MIIWHEIFEYLLLYSCTSRSFKKNVRIWLNEVYNLRGDHQQSGLKQSAESFDVERCA